jgi:hypothetical protein
VAVKNLRADTLRRIGSYRDRREAERSTANPARLASLGRSATVLTPAKDVLDSTAFTYVEVVNGEVGSSIGLHRP